MFWHKMISSRLVSPISLNGSERQGSLGGLISSKLVEATFTFDEEESILGKRKYKFFYLMNDLETTDFSIYKLKITSYILHTSHVDKFSQGMLGNFNIDIVLTSFFGKNTLHKTYTEFGEILEFNKNIEEFILASEKTVTIYETLNFGDFYPIAVRVSINKPIERVYKLPIVLEIYSYLR